MWITKVGIEKKEIHLLISWAVWQYLQIYSPHLVTSTRGSNDKCESAHLCSSHCIAAPQLAVMWRRLSDKLINPFYFSFSWADFLALNVWEWKDSSVLFKVTDCCCKDTKSWLLSIYSYILFMLILADSMGCNKQNPHFTAPKMYCQLKGWCKHSDSYLCNHIITGKDVKSRQWFSNCMPWHHRSLWQSGGTCQGRLPGPAPSFYWLSGLYQLGLHDSCKIALNPRWWHQALWKTHPMTMVITELWTTE